VYALPVEAVLSGAFLGLIVGDALDHETSQHYPMQPRRAFGFGLASFAALTGLGLIGNWFANPMLWILLTGSALASASLIAFIALGVTQTNRLKPWVKELNRTYEIGDRFSQDPASAARFGLYTVVIWVLAFAGFVVLSITVGFAWSWLALLGGLVVFFLVLARMLFPADSNKK
jgi:ABC-type glycerol-3-phosphate transport system permease component